MIRPSHVCTKCGAFWKLRENSWQLISRECSRCCDNVRMGDHVELLEDTEPQNDTINPPDVEAIISASRLVCMHQSEIHKEDTFLRFRAAFGAIAELQGKLTSYDNRLNEA